MATPSRGRLQSGSEYRCEDCQYWNRIDSRIGECRRGAPAALTTVEVEDTVVANKGIWPRTYNAEWCGEFEPA